jgi:hypothetical protein
VTDTSPIAQAVQAAVLRRMSGEERLGLGCAMSDAARELALSRLRSLHPGWSARRLARTLIQNAFAPHLPPPALR